MDPQAQPGRTSRAGWLQPMAAHYVLTGRCQEGAPPRTILTSTGAQDVEKRVTELRHALKQRKRKPLTPYHCDVWDVELEWHGLWGRYPKLIQGLKGVFDLGIPGIHKMHALQNHWSISILNDVYNSIIQNEFAASRYIGPFTRAQLEASLGPFQMSPLLLVPMTSKLGKYQAVHNFSRPHNPLPAISCINSSINSDDFPCTWGTFPMVFLLVACLPPGSQASVRNVAEAYQTIPTLPSQWPGLVIHLQDDDQFAVNVCNNFGLMSAGGVYGMVADTGADIFCSSGISPLLKWVNDHIFFRILWEHLPEYNARQEEWKQDIQTQGGCRQTGSRIWYGGKNIPEGSSEEFDEDCSAIFADMAGSSSRSVQDQDFTYTDTDIDKISACLGIHWEPSKSIPFRTEVPYLGFCWDLQARVVHLLKEKKHKYLAAILEWESQCTHNLLDTQHLHRKLLHATLVLPAG